MYSRWKQSVQAVPESVLSKPDKDGNVKQYIEKQDSRDIELKDLSGMESLAKADELMQQWLMKHLTEIISRCVNLLC